MMVPENANGATHNLEDRPESSRGRPSAAAFVLLGLAGWIAWRPVESFPFSAVLVAVLVFSLTIWGWRRTRKVPLERWLALGSLFLVLCASGFSGWDPASAVGELALLAAVLALIWLASRRRPPDCWPAVLALVISALALWGLQQVLAGPERAAAILAQLPDHIRAAAAERLASGRAFASLTLPSHLAVLLATALPLLLARIHLRLRSWPWVLGSLLCVVGLILSRSPIGIALALAACLLLAASRGRRKLWWAVPLLLVLLVSAVVGRSDVMELEPFRLRLDNWRTATWVWSTAPIAGVGVGGFAQAAQAVPFSVGNRPRHAHSLPFEWFSELGTLGLLAAGFVLIFLLRLARDLWSEHPELSVAVMVIPIHNLVDFSLYTTGVALPWAILVGWAMASRRRDSTAAAAVPGRIVAVVAATLAVAGTMLHATSIKVAESAAVADTTLERFEGGLEARRLAPWRVDPLALIAGSAIESGDPDVLRIAASELENGRFLRPRSSALAGLWARLALASGMAPTAVSEAWVSRHARPSNEEAQAFYVDLVLRLDGGGVDEDR